jgi:ribosomal protein L37E
MPLTKWSSKHRKTWNDKRPDEKIYLEHHRHPPKPDHYYKQKKGYCRMCGESIIKNNQINKRASWHPDCVDEYMLIYHQNEARKQAWSRDKGKCAQCGVILPRKSRTKNLKWHVDHIKPLFEQKGKHIDDIDFNYWKMNNLQTLCFECHAVKSADEAKTRAEMRKKK